MSLVQCCKRYSHSVKAKASDVAFTWVARIFILTDDRDQRNSSLPPSLLPSVNTPPPSANKAVHSGFETQRRLHQKSKTGVSVPPNHVSTNFFLKIV